MKKLLLFFLFAGVAVAQSNIGGNSSSGGGTSNATAASIVTTGLIGYYQALPGETVASLKDYSTAGNNATGTAGTAPTIIANTGGLQCNANGGVKLPSALNSAVSIQIEFGYQPSGVSQGYYAMVIGNGTPATNGLGIGLAQGNLPQSGPTPGQPTVLGNTFGTFWHNWAGPGALLDIAVSYIAGIGDVALVMKAANDSLYYNGQNELLYQQIFGVMLGSMDASGTYQLCGAAAGAGLSIQTYFQGQIYAALFYNTALTDAQVYQNHIALQNAMMARGINPLPYRNDTADAIWAYGDSTTAGGGAIGWTNRVVGLNGPWNPINMGRGGATATQLNTIAAISGDPICSTQGGRSATVLLTGANDSVAQTVFASARSILAGRKFPNCSKPVTILETQMPNSAHGNAEKNAYNALVRANCYNTADYCIDLGETVALGADNAYSNATYFQGDLIHPTQAGFDILTWITQRGINRYFGNHDLTTANVYTSPATAAVAVTAATETGNVVTFTTAANTFTAGQCITVAGVTPTTYNSTFANSAGLGCWYALTVGATSFTAWNQNTGITALTVAGTAVAPQQVDADQAYIVNFGAGNTTLEPCDGLTINDLQRITNINAVASTIVPFGSQTINGAATSTLAANSTAVLQAQLVSAAAGGCNWIRLQ
jgi:hypothetical protein